MEIKINRAMIHLLEAIKQNEGYCLCKTEKINKNKCICEEFL